MKIHFAEIFKSSERKVERGSAQLKPKPTTEKTELVLDGLAMILVAALLVFSAAARGYNLVLALGAMFVGFLVVDYFWGGRNLRNLRAKRKLPDAFYVDEPFYVEIEIDATERKGAAWAIVVEDEWTPEEAAYDAPKDVKTRSRAVANGRDAASKRTKRKNKTKRGEDSTDKFNDADAVREGAETTKPVAYFPTVRGGERIKEYYVGVMTRRGRRALSALTVSTRFPCGFFRTSHRYEAREDAIVFPKTGRLGAGWDAFVGSLTQEATVATSGTSRAPDETVAIRDWRVGDSKRAIAWRATAKRDRLQTRQFARRRARSLALVLDLYDPDAASIHDSPQKWLLVEKAISFAATLVERWTATDARLEFALNADESHDREGVERDDKLPEWNEVSANGSTRRVMTRLALALATPTDKLAERLVDANARSTSDAQILVVSLRPFDAERFAGTYARRGDERWIDVSADNFDRVFEFEASDDALDEELR